MVDLEYEGRKISASTLTQGFYLSALTFYRLKVIFIAKRQHSGQSYECAG